MSVAHSASRALGLVIKKTKDYVGFPFGKFSKLYESTVSSVISYGPLFGVPVNTRVYMRSSIAQVGSFLALENLRQMLPVEGDMG